MRSEQIIEQVRARIGFAKFELDITTCTLDELVLMINTPEEGTACKAYPNAPVAGSAFSQMYEHALHGGFIRCPSGIKVLVIYTERPATWHGYEFEMLPLERIKHFKKPKPIKLAKQPRRPRSLSSVS